MATQMSLGSITKPEESTQPRKRPPMPRRTKILFYLVTWLIVLMPFLFWRGTWFGRPLSDAEITKYLRDDQKPRHIQHALVQIGERMNRGNHNIGQWSATGPLGQLSGGRGPQHRRLGDGAGQLQSAVP